jgi:type VII secretion protein EccB
MQSRRDLFQAHRLMTQRAALALLRGEPDIPDQPLRRLNVAAFSGVLVAVIVAALFGIWGLLGHGDSQLQPKPGTLVIDKQTGTAYVFCQGGKLCPVLNYASARLALQSSSVDQQTVSQASLTKFARGPLIGIPGLPQPLPDPGLLLRQPWSVCVQTVLGLSGDRTSTTLVGGIGTGGHSLAGGALLAQALGQDWVIWDGQRMPVQPSRLQALFVSRQPVAVPPVWLNALPQGPAFVPPVIAGQDTPVSGPGGTVLVGQVFEVTAVGGTPPRYYVMLRSGLAPISQTQAELLDFEPSAPKPSMLNASQVSGHLSTATVPSGGLPTTVPVVPPRISSSAPLCVAYGATGAGSTMARQVVLGGRVPSGGTPTGRAADVDRVTLPPGAGALVGAAPGTGRVGGAISYFLVAGGRRYALASQSVAAMLGYNLSRQAVQLPAGVIDLIPLGPALDPAEATRPVSPGG